MDWYTKREIKKYPPALQKEIEKHWEDTEKYMADDSIPPMFGEKKSRLDMDARDEELALKRAKYDLLYACMEDLNKVKQILKRWSDHKEELLNFRDGEGFNGLDYSIMYLQPDIEKYLLKQGAKESAKTASVRRKTAANLEEMDIDIDEVRSRLDSGARSKAKEPKGKKTSPASRLDQ